MSALDVPKTRDSVVPQRKAWKAHHVGTYLAYAAIAAVVLFPLSWVLLGSFKDPSEIFAYPTTFIPREFTLTNYSDVIRRTDLPSYLINSAIVALVSLALTLSFSTVAAYGFSRWA